MQDFVIGLCAGGRDYPSLTAAGVRIGLFGCRYTAEQTPLRASRVGGSTCMRWKEYPSWLSIPQNKIEGRLIVWAMVIRYYLFSIP